MSYHRKQRKFGRVRKQRKALLRSLALSLLARRKIITTEAKAKELRPYVEKLITLGKKDTLASRRIARARLGGNSQAEKYVYQQKEAYKGRSGGYTRITKLPRRKGDASKMAAIEFI